MMPSTFSSPPDGAIEFGAELLDELFPFHLVCDEELRVLRRGPIAARAVPGLVPGTLLKESLRILRPSFAPDCAAIRKRQAHAFLLEAANGLRLRGQVSWRERERILLFLLSPWIADGEEAGRLGISLSDLPVHDAAREFMYVVKLQRDAVASASRAFDELQAQKRHVEEMRDAAIEANRSKSAFLAMMSHEIRTPLNGVIGMMDYMLTGPLPSEQRDCLRTAQESALGLLAILNDILDLSKLEAGRMEIAVETFDLVTTLESVVTIFLPQAEAKGLRLVVEAPADLHSLRRGDGLRLRQILMNLLSNAIKFTSSGQVRLRCWEAAGFVHFEVADTGAGVPPALAEKLFQPFQQIGIQTSGTGLGLSICRRLTELMGGAIAFEPGPERGAVFRFFVSLPPQPFRVPAGEGRSIYTSVAEFRELLRGAGWNLVDAPAAGVLELEERHCVQWTRDLARSAGKIPVAPLSQSRLEEFLSNAAPAAMERAGQGVVLVVEDGAVNQRVASLMLSRLGYEAEIAADGAEGVRAAAGRPYSFVLMDMQMPVMNGLDATRHIRSADGPNRDAPIIALTANAFSRDRTACLEAGMNFVLTKPVQLQALDDAIRSATSRRQTHTG